jgi:hypothetical protein
MGSSHLQGPFGQPRRQRVPPVSGRRGTFGGGAVARIVWSGTAGSIARTTAANGTVTDDPRVRGSVAGRESLMSINLPMTLGINIYRVKI